MKGWVLITREAQELPELQPWVPEELELVAFPVLRQVPWEEPAAWERLARHLAELAVIACTSRHAPRPFLAQAQRRGLDAALTQLPVAAVGEATAAACREVGLSVALVGSQGGAALAETISQQIAAPSAVVFPCGREHREELVSRLHAAGFEVFPLPVYAMEPANPSQLPPLPPGSPRAVVLTSPRAASHYWQLTQGQFSAVPHLAWGATTAQELQKLGLAFEVLPQPNPKGLKEALCRIL